MRDIPDNIDAHLAESVTTLAACWQVRRKDGVLILGTEHDQDITISEGHGIEGWQDLRGTYAANAGITGSTASSTPDMSVDNMEVNGAIDPLGVSIIDLAAADIESGLFDDAEVMLFLVNWAAPNDGEVLLRWGTIGEITRTSDGRYRTELRGLTQKLSQVVTRTYGASCDAELGDVRCKYEFAAGEVTTGVVTVATSNRAFSVTLADAQLDNYYNGGLLTWTSGDNESFSMEVKRFTPGTSDELQLFLPMPRDVQVGDTFSVMPGCDKSVASCKGKFNNLVNFRGHGNWVPGRNQILTFATQQRVPKKKNKKHKDGGGRGFSG